MILGCKPIISLLLIPQTRRKMKVYFVVVIVLVLITLTEGGKYKGRNYHKIIKAQIKAQKICQKITKRFDGCLVKGYKSYCDETDDGEFKE